jgi:hypothetical protein
MAQLAVIHKASEGWTPITQYDSTKWSLGDLIKRRTDISTNGSGSPYIGPCIDVVARPFEESPAIAASFPSAVQWSNRLFRYSSGTVTVSGTTVTGTGTLWITTGITINVNIGFGSTDATQITTWYNIDSIQSDTGLTLSTVATTYTGATSYVIENFRQIDWVFFADGASAAITRRIQLYEFNRMNSVWGWKGFITITPTATATHTTRGLVMDYMPYSVGTVTVSGTAVSGTTTNWFTNRMCVGSRIGFGSTDPTQIKTWFYISSINSNLGITLTQSAPTYAGATSYVIEDLRAYYETTNTTSGGLFVAKGLTFDDFTSLGTTIPIGGGTDNLKQTYWLKDASTINNTAACGITVEPQTSWTGKTAYVIDTATIKIYKYNVRNPLTLTGAADTSSFLAATGNQAVTGAITQTNNGKYCIANHGPLSGQTAVYFVTSNRIYGVPTSLIVNASTTFLTGGNQMLELPPGSLTGTTYTFTAPSGMTCIDYMDTIDRFVVTSTGANGIRSYVTQFVGSGTTQNMDYIFLLDDKQLDQSFADINTVQHPSISALTHAPNCIGGIMYSVTIGTTAATNFVHAMPIGVEWGFAATTLQRAISPSFSTPNAVRYTGFFTWRDTIIGGDLLGKRSDGFRTYYRMTGITDNSGTWNLISEPSYLTMTGITPSGSIQFMHEFRGITDNCIPARIFAAGVTYEDSSTDSHYRFSVTGSSITAKTFTFRFTNAFGDAVPQLRIRIYNDVLGGAAIVDDDTVSNTSRWSKSIDNGVTWNSYDTLDKFNDTTYIKYTSTNGSLDGIKAEVVLTLY